MFSKRFKIILVFVVSITIGIFFLCQKFLHSKNINVSPNTQDIDQISNTINYTMTLTQNGKYSYPVVTGYFNKESQDKVNEDIANIFYEFGCWENTNDTERFDGAMTMGVDYADHDLISITQDGWYTCDDISDINALETFTFDMRSGERINFEELFSDYEKDKEEIMKTIYGDFIYSAYVYENKQQQYDPEFIEDSEDVCSDGMYTLDMFVQTPWHNYTIVPETRGVLVTPSFASPHELCAIPTEISIDSLMSFLAPDSIVKRF